MNADLLATGAARIAVIALVTASTRAQFGPEQPIDAAGASVLDAHGADLDGDGDPDLIASRNGTPVLCWYRNDGGGASFSAPQPFPGSPWSAEIARAIDFDLDGDLDVVASVSYYQPSTGVDDRLDYFENPGDGALQFYFWWNYDAPVTALDVADLEGDGDADLFFAEWSHGLVYAQPVHSGGLGAPQLVSSVTSGVAALRACDLDADGDADVAVAQPFSGSFSWFENGAAGFGPKLVLGAGATGHLASIDARDLDADGDVDLLGSISASSTSRVQSFANQGAGAFAAAVTIPLPKWSTDAHAQDLDGDGHHDLVVAESSGVSWFANSGSASFGAANAISATGGGSVELADIDGDGDRDVVTNTSSGQAGLAWFENLAVFVWTDLGAGLVGDAGVPALSGTGSLLPGSAGKLALYAAAPSAPAVLLIAPSAGWAPFACGTLVPSLAGGTLVVAPTNAAGKSSLAWSAWPSGLSGASLYSQCGVLDPAAACGIAFSNALRAAVP